MACPKCGGTNTGKEYLFGMDTGDRECYSCGHIFMRERPARVEADTKKGDRDDDTA